ncbi:hypothetical protein GCM10027061_15110 [Nesterenkonia suensis]
MVVDHIADLQVEGAVLDADVGDVVAALLRGGHREGVLLGDRVAVAGVLGAEPDVPERLGVLPEGGGQRDGGIGDAVTGEVPLDRFPHGVDGVALVGADGRIHLLAEVGPVPVGHVDALALVGAAAGGEQPHRRQDDDSPR